MFLDREYININVNNIIDNSVIVDEHDVLIKGYEELGNRINNIIKNIEDTTNDTIQRFEYDSEMDRTSIDFDGNFIEVFIRKAVEYYKIFNTLNFTMVFNNNSYVVDIVHNNHVGTPEEIRESKRLYTERKGKFYNVNVCDVDAFIPVVNEIILTEESYDFINEIITLIEIKTNSKFRGIYHSKGLMFSFNVYYESDDGDVEYLKSDDANKYLRDVFNGEKIYYLFFVLSFDNGKYYNVTIKKEA